MPGRLREAFVLAVESKATTKIDSGLWAHSVSHVYSKDIQILKISCSIRMRILPEWFASLEMVKLPYFENISTWNELFSNPHVGEALTELRVFDIYLEQNMNDFRKFLDHLPNLEVYVHTYGKLGFAPVTAELYRRYPNLRGFGYKITLRDGDGCSSIALDEHVEVLQQFRNLTEFHLYCTVKCMNLYSIIKFVPNIKVLGLWEINRLFQPPADYRRIVHAIKQAIAARCKRFPNNNDRVHLLVDLSQYKDFKVIKNIEHFVHLTIHTSMKY